MFRLSLSYFLSLSLSAWWRNQTEESPAQENQTEEKQKVLPKNALLKYNK